MSRDALDDHPFALCLTHDVDRPYKTYQSAYYAATRRDPRQLLDLLPGRNPYWRFDDIRELEADMGVRSAFYFLDEQDLWDRPVRSWFSPRAWRLYAGRYDLEDPAIRRAIRALDAGGWEVGLHGSYESYRDPDRLRAEKRRLQSVLGGAVRGCRQHYLNLDPRRTWGYQADAGLRYDASLGSSTGYGFENGYRVQRPFDDEFVVFPLTAMEVTLPDPGTESERARRECERLLAEARSNGAVMTVLWHVKTFSDRDFPGYRALYVYLVRRAKQMGAWVGPPGEYYDRLSHPDRGAQGESEPETATPPDGTD